MPSSAFQTCALRSEEHTSELQSHDNLVCGLLLEKKSGDPAIRGGRGGLLPPRSVLPLGPVGALAARSPPAGGPGLARGGYGGLARFFFLRERARAGRALLSFPPRLLI